MFFRLKATKTGQVLKLLESYRDAAQVPRHRTVVSLGNADIPASDWRAIAKAVEDILHAHEALFPPELSPEQAAWVDRIVAQVNNEGKWRRPPSAPAQPPSDVIDGVLGGQVTHTNTTELGTVLVGWEIWKCLGMPELLEELGFNADQCRSAAISVINRLVDPSSEHSLPEWYRRTGLPELMDNALRGCGDDRFYRVSDKLLTHRKTIEQHLRERQRSLFNLNRTVLLYDLTKTHFEGLCKRNPKAKRGKNKQKRDDCLQIVVGMLFDQYGFEMSHQVFEGNQSDSKSLIEMVDALSASVPPDGTKPLVIMDAGIATEENLRLLREHGFGYLVNDTRTRRKRYIEEFRQSDAFTEVPDRPGKPPVLVRIIPNPHPSEDADPSRADRIVLCKSEQRGEKENAMLSNAEQHFLDALEKLAQRIEKGRLKVRSKMERCIGRICARHPRVSRYYTVAIEEVPDGSRLAWQRHDEMFAEAADLWGCYVLRTDEQTLNEHELWELYISLTRAEDGFKALKTDLGLRPNPHHKEERVDGHVFICVIAYHLLRNILWTLEQQGDTRSWESIKRVLRTHCYTTILLPTRDGSTHRIRKAGQPEECQKAIYQALGINWNRLPAHRSIVNKKRQLAPTKNQSIL